MKTQFKFGILSCVCVFSFYSCVSPSKQSETPHLVNPALPQQGPSVIEKTTPPVLKPITPVPPPAVVVDSRNIEKIIHELSLIESSFLAQNCDAVLEHTRLLQSLNFNQNLSEEPPLIHAAIYTCDAKAGLNDPVRLQNGVTQLKSVTLRYPIINEPWIHNTLADFYVALKDIPNALAEKKQARDLLLTQQQDISSLNEEILKLDPSSAAQTQETQSPSLSPASPTVDQIISSATQLINNDSPDQAIALLDTLSPEKKTENVKRIRREAVHSLVTNLRFKVRALFMRSTEQTGAERIESLQQCQQILSGIIKNYPEYSDMSAVSNNLKQVQRELNKN